MEELGLTHQELAKQLKTLATLWGRTFIYHGRAFRVESVAFLGWQDSPFQDGTETSADVTVYNLTNGKKLWYSLLVPQMIERYGFYEGKGTRYRVDPSEIVEVLDFLKDKPRKPAE